MSFPREIGSAVSDAEAAKLQELAQDRLVLEMGAHLGFSTVVLAQVATKVHSVDWHRGDASAGPGDLAAYLGNLRSNGVEDRVVTHLGRFEDVLPLLGLWRFGLAFVDGEHDRGSVNRDISLALPRLRAPGWLAIHDYGRFEVAAAVDAWAAARNWKVEVIDHLAVVEVW